MDEIRILIAGGGTGGHLFPAIAIGEKISLKRLQARPIATLSIDAQEKHERLEKTFRDD